MENTDNIKWIDENTRVVFKLCVLMDANYSKYHLQRKRRFLWFTYWKTVSSAYHVLHSSYEIMLEHLLWYEDYAKKSERKKAKEAAFYSAKVSNPLKTQDEK